MGKSKKDKNRRKRTQAEKQRVIDWELMNQEGPIRFSRSILTMPKEYLDALEKGLTK